MQTRISCGPLLTPGLGNKDTDMEILKATPEHAEEITLLNDAVQKIHAEHHPELFKYPTDASEVEGFFRNQIAADGNSIFIARADSRTVGYVWCTIKRKRENPFKYGRETIYIHQISVYPEYRRKGVGRKLMEAVESLAKQKGICRLALDSWEFNGEAHAFFERLGFFCYNVNMWQQTKKE